MLNDTSRAARTAMRIPVDLRKAILAIKGVKPMRLLVFSIA